MRVHVGQHFQPNPVAPLPHVVHGGARQGHDAGAERVRVNVVVKDELPCRRRLLRLSTEEKRPASLDPTTPVPEFAKEPLSERPGRAEIQTRQHHSTSGVEQAVDLGEVVSDFLGRVPGQMSVDRHPGVGDDMGQRHR